MTRVPGLSQRAGIIAAGRGDRLRHGTHTLKPLVPIAGRALIEHVLTSVAETAPSEVVIIVNEASIAVRDHVTARRWPFAIRWIVESTPSSMHSFLRVLEALAPDGPDNRDGPFLMSTVDTIAPPGAYASFCSASRLLDADVALALARPGDDEKPLLVRLAPGSSRIEAMGDEIGLKPDAEIRLKPDAEIRLKPDPTYDAGNTYDEGLGRRRTESDRGVDLWSTAGYYAVRATVLREADAARRDGFPALRTFFTNLVGRGYRLNGILVSGAVDVDRPADVQAAEAFLKQLGASCG